MDKSIFFLPTEARFTTFAGLEIIRRSEHFTDAGRIDTLIDRIDRRCGVLLSSGTQVPGRYDSHDLGFADPPVRLTSRGEGFSLVALNARGRVLVTYLDKVLSNPSDLAVEILERAEDGLTGRIVKADAPMDEELRTRRPTIFTLIREIIAAFHCGDTGPLGLYGAFGYDVVFQLEDIAPRLQRAEDQRDIVLFIPDRLIAFDRRTGRGLALDYEFSFEGASTEGLGHDTPESVYRADGGITLADHEPGAYRQTVEAARQAFARGDLFEAVPGQLFGEPCTKRPADVFRRLCEINPAPYGAFMNLDEGEFLVSASPEMFVRSDGRRVETCPISGTIKRGRDAIDDARQIQALLNSDKDAWELNMCTDVDRNDKARVCEPGSIRILARRQIETYSKLFHTVDHVEGILRPGYDALDALLSHAWAVTVTGAPKLWAMRFIEENERSPRRWYGGAIGAINFDGSVNTGITIRTVRMKNGTAEIRVGATLLYDSDPVAEEEECGTKAAALFQALRGTPSAAELSRIAPVAIGAGKRVLLVDHEDSFVHMLADYFRQTGAQVTVVRHGNALAAMEGAERPDLVVMSPGPGRPEDFDTRRTLDKAIGLGLPVFGVCLGMQALGEYFGGRLMQLPTPAHGRSGMVATRPGMVFDGLEGSVSVGRYHSLYLDPKALPRCLRLVAETEDGLPMGVEHESLPIAAVQFHPESLMTLEGGAGIRIVENVMRNLSRKAAEAAA